MFTATLLLQLVHKSRHVNTFQEHLKNNLVNSSTFAIRSSFTILRAFFVAKSSLFSKIRFSTSFPIPEIMSLSKFNSFHFHTKYITTSIRIMLKGFRRFMVRARLVLSIIRFRHTHCLDTLLVKGRKEIISRSATHSPKKLSLTKHGKATSKVGLVLRNSGHRKTINSRR